MRVEIVHTGGRYSQRVIAHLSEMSPGNVLAYQVPSALPMVVDDPAEHLPAGLGSGEVIAAIHLHPDLLLEIPSLARGKGVRALIAPIEDPTWIKPGLQRQVTQACANAGIESAFPKPFCSLECSTPAIGEFCEQFRVGVPTFRFTIKEGKIASAEVLRGSPCGLTHFVAQQLVGLPADDTLSERAGHFHHSYPCLASMALDPATGETVMHASLYLLRDRVKEGMEEAREGSAGT